jgi:hypothetical protein
MAEPLLDFAEENMPRYVIERQYLVPIYEHVLVEAPTFEAACRKAMDDTEEPWGDNAKTDYENSRPTTIELAVQVSDSNDFDAYDSSLSYLLYQAGLEPLPIPREFTEEIDDADISVGFV